MNGMDSTPNVLHVAKLANLELPSSQSADRVADVENIIRFIESLQVVVVEDVPPTNQVTELENIYRPDDVVASVHHQTLLERAPRRRGTFVEAPGVFDQAR